ncbi:MAG: TRAP transporter large permease [Synergistaceae bacterium]|jgi:C4-dicarboxylate transporter DctM subunit|nr:TRAP transporter large permease [Synergistaceae bacterium]
MITFLLLSMVILLLVGVPIGIALGTASLLTILQSPGLNWLIVTQKLLNGVNHFSMLAIPFFILAGEIFSTGGVSGRLLYLANRLVGKFTGGLSMVATLAAAFFGAISGSSAATTAAIGGIMIPSMKKAGYDNDYSAAVVAASGLLGIIIPPSGTMLMYAVIANVSVLEMFTGGIIPGILMAFSLMAVEYFCAKKRSYGQSSFEIEEFRNKKRSTIIFESFAALLSPIIILGGIYAGVFTATEAAGVAVLYGLLVSCFLYRQIKLKDLYRNCVSSGISTSMIMFLIGAAAVFGWVLTVQQVPTKIVSAIRTVTSSPHMVLLLCNLVLLVAGALLDNVAAITLLTPVLVPLIKSYGIDPTFFGLIMIINLAIGQITPPIGMNLFVAANISGSKVEKIVGQVVPFLLVLIVDLFVFTYVPQIVTFLPSLVGKMPLRPY